MSHLKAVTQAELSPLSVDEAQPAFRECMREARAAHGASQVALGSSTLVRDLYGSGRLSIHNLRMMQHNARRALKAVNELVAALDDAHELYERAGRRKNSEPQH